jgi:menaquinone-9 beta-reductase
LSHHRPHAPPDAASSPGGASHEPPRSESYDVAVVGAGIAGLAASVFLRQAGLAVICLDGQAYPHQKVGESLDWSSPGLLERLGLSTDVLIADEIATHKTNIVVSEVGKVDWQVAPPPAIRRSPLRFETVTLHVDRAALDQRIYEKARALDTTFVWERVTRVTTEGERVTGCVTASGRRVEARFYVDASGVAGLLARTMTIPRTTYGRPKVCLWTYFETPPLHRGTTFFLDNRDSYLRWVWDIPISPRRTSVGFVLPADAVQVLRRTGATTEAILGAELARHPRFEALLASQPAFAVESTSFQPFVTTQVCGPNWIMAGEAASMPDPLTGNGVTSGIRHARYAAEVILGAGAGREIPVGRRRTYSRHVLRLGRSFNAHIEHAVYRHPLRWALGMPAATVIYTLFAFFMNASYARFDPRGPISMAVFDLLFAVARQWIAAWSLAARFSLWFMRPPGGARSDEPSAI